VEGLGVFLADYELLAVPLEREEVHRPEIVVPKLIIAEDGSIAKVVKERAKVAVTGASQGAQRGVVQTFSKASRRRLLRLLAKTDKADRPLFVTLTYPDDFPDNPREIKRHLDAFGKRFRRKFPAGAFIWKLEYKARKSGQNTGKIAPHFHLLAWGGTYKDMLGWVSGSWAGVVKSEDEKHLKAGTNVEKLRSWRGVMAYASKYIAKVNVEELPEGVGRFWGVVGRDNLPLSGVLVVTLTALQAIKATRLGRKYLSISGKNLQYGLTFLIDGKAMVKYAEWLLGGFEGGESQPNGGQSADCGFNEHPPALRQAPKTHPISGQNQVQQFDCNALLGGSLNYDTPIIQPYTLLMPKPKNLSGCLFDFNG